MDILYYIGSGSHHNNQELRYSLRTLEAHCKDISKVWIVGNKPHFLNGNVTGQREIDKYVREEILPKLKNHMIERDAKVEEIRQRYPYPVGENDE